MPPHALTARQGARGGGGGAGEHLGRLPPPLPALLLLHAAPRRFTPEPSCSALCPLASLKTGSRCLSSRPSLLHFRSDLGRPFGEAPGFMENFRPDSCGLFTTVLRSRPFMLHRVFARFGRQTAQQCGIYLIGETTCEDIRALQKRIMLLLQIEY